MNPILIAIIILGSVALLSALLLGIASRVSHVNENPLIASVGEALPGVNCGGCGYPGCANYAKAIVDNNVEVTLCAPGGNEVIAKISALLGRAVVAKDAEVARLSCFGKPEFCAPRCDYQGIQTCRAANLQNGGQKKCLYGCLGFGDCVSVCPFGAMSMVDGLPFIDEEKCTGCAICVRECPKKLLTLQNKKRQVYLHCASKEFGKVVKEACTVGCNGCSLCARKCPEKALTMVDNLPIWDWSKCTQCGLCAKVCPSRIIFLDGRPVPKEAKEAPSA